ncbi:hypothetical protein DFH08DRAFT_956919 [Mycena albidolilacea]|uniref:CxC2-like cysteine cluster KDZ transposase-associated domain-containing protein n=1 Tax=Mycena albidolilacea TaxID=1033008 RepID=A0AAD7EV86_9AGAR|nr:hypothetical protein DFH08DRAFT_956919 [Mycena albidolilacea]
MSSRRLRRFRGKHVEILSGDPSASSSSVSASGTSSVSSHLFSASDFLPNARVDRPINAFVDETSGDLRRMHRSVLPIAPPSPVKRARLADTMVENVVPSWDPALPHPPNECYVMFGDDEFEDPPLPPPPRPPRTRAALFSDPTLYKWKADSRDRYLREFLRHDGCGDASESVCPGCKDSAHPPAYRCRECRSGMLFCRECFVKQHVDNLLHVVEAWNGSCFERTSLQAMGLRVQFGHRPGEYCAAPEPGRKGFVVLHHNGVHEVAVDFCGCEHRGQAGAPDTQLLRGGWYPASEEQPQTCMTLVALEQFHLSSLQAKMTMYDYYQCLEKLTRNDGVKPPDRYQVFIRICRQYRHLMMLKRGGRGHDPGGAEATASGELAVRCPTCPRPGINLPEGWDRASKEDRFIYFMYFALDTCFRLKRGMVSSELKDPGLGTGWAYMLENMSYREYLLTVTDQKEMSTCSGLAALDYANTKFSRGYSSTGVGIGVCARHEFVQPNGVGDLQKGERYANIDYIFGSILRYYDERLFKMVSYDIACQWWKLLMERMIELPPLVRCLLIMPLIAFVIPKMQIKGHIPECGILYSLSLIPGSGQTDGEGIERPWANIGGIASSTRIMGPGARHDTIDDHWGHWNWQKLVSLGDTLRRRLDNAREQEIVHTEALDSFSQQQQERVESWKKMVHDYEDDRSKKNPYEVVFVGLTEAQVRLQFQKDEEEAAKRGIPAKHKVSLSEFITECLNVEEEQREVRVQAALKKAQTTNQQIDLGALRTKLIRRLDRLRKLQGTYCPAAIVALDTRETPENEQPESEPLFLPSALSEAERENGGCTKGLLEMELLLRDAQCRASLVKLRNQLVIKGHFLNYKALHARHQGATTRARGIVNRNEMKIRLHSEKYQCAWNVLFAYAGQDEGREAKRKKARERRKRKLDELVAHAVDAPAWLKNAEDEDLDGDEEGRVGESRRQVSWIWTGAGMTGTDAELEDALRIEWAKAYARARRWNEEVRLLTEEFRRVPISLECEADRWLERARVVPVGTDALHEAYAQGMIAYAIKQESLGKKRPRPANIDPLVEAMGAHTTGGVDDGSKDEEENGGVREEDNGDADEGRIVESDEELVMGGEVDDI